MAHIYNSIPLIEEAAVALSTLQAFVVPQLKTLLNQYHLGSDFGIVLVHRHFDLKSAEEQVVDMNGPGTLVSSVFSHGRPDSQVVHEYNLDMPSPFAIVPSKFLVRDELVPYEYKCVPKDDENLYRSRTKRLPQKFLKDWYVILGSYRAQDKLGVVDLLTEEEIHGFEWTDTVRRFNVVKTRTDSITPENYIPTLWQSRKDSKISRACACPARRPKKYPRVRLGDDGWKHIKV